MNGSNVKKLYENHEPSLKDEIKKYEKVLYFFLCIDYSQQLNILTVLNAATFYDSGANMKVRRVASSYIHFHDAAIFTPAGAAGAAYATTIKVAAGSMPDVSLGTDNLTADIVVAKNVPTQ